jgi:hypothetical protein
MQIHAFPFLFAVVQPFSFFGVAVVRQALCSATCKCRSLLATPFWFLPLFGKSVVRHCLHSKVQYVALLVLFTFFYSPVNAVLALPLFGKPFVICLHLNALSFCNYSANQFFHFRFKSISIRPVHFGRVIGNVWSLSNEWIYPDMGSTV